MMKDLRPWFGIFAGAGAVLAAALFTLGFSLLRSLFAAGTKEETERAESERPAEKEAEIPAV
jgi:hypothetical protein